MGDSPIPSESGAGSESGFGSPASLGQWDLRVKSLTGTGKGPQTRPCGFGSPGSYIGTILNVYAAAGSTRTNDFIDNSRPCDHNRKLCGSSHITPKFVTYAIVLFLSSHINKRSICGSCEPTDLTCFTIVFNKDVTFYYFT